MIGAKTNDQAREYFKNSGLTYESIKLDDLRLLEAMLNRNFADQVAENLKNGEGLYWKRVNPAKYYKGQYDNENRLICAYMTGAGGYFNAREVISFNRDGFIGFSGEADSSNTQPVIDAFIEWVDYMRGEI